MPSIKLVEAPGCWPKRAMNSTGFIFTPYRREGDPRNRPSLAMKKNRAPAPCRWWAWRWVCWGFA